MSTVTLVLHVSMTDMTCTLHFQSETEVEDSCLVHNVWKVERILILPYIWVEELLVSCRVTMQDHTAAADRVMLTVI